MRYTGPKNRLARREGIDLGLKTPGTKSHAALLKRLNIIPGQHGARRRRKQTDYGLQLREKQKLKRLYSISEKQMKNYFKKASQTVGNTAEFLSQQLERRLDSVVFRLGFAPTRASARQLIAHGHIAINEKKVTIPSYLVGVNDLIGFVNERSLKIPYIGEMVVKKDFIVSPWLERKGPLGKVAREPRQEDVKDDINLQSVVEFYSR